MSPTTTPISWLWTRRAAFRDGIFDPGPAGAAIVREWQLADEPAGGPADLLAALALATPRRRCRSG